jgi:hypothetical protein
MSVVFPWVKRPELKLTGNINLVLRLKICVYPHTSVRCVRWLKANSHILYRSHAAPMPCRQEFRFIFPIWFTQCGRLWFTHGMPRPCHATTIPFWKRLIKTMAQRGMGMAWLVRISIGRPETACGQHACRSATSGYHEGCYQKHNNPLNCKISSSDISGYHTDFHEGNGTDGEWQVHAPRH